MNLFAMMETSGGAMQAERMRAEVVAANMANAETTRTPSGGAYHRQHVVFAANPGSGLGGDTSFANTLNAATGSASSGGAAFTAASSGSVGSAALPQLLAPISAFNLNGMLSGFGKNAGTVAPGVHIAAVVEDTSAPLKRYDPGNPDAGADGYVSYPDINPVTEMVDLMGATRAYGLNSSAVQAEKGMISSALEIAKS
jgi:flagellar basal-body rod protein FlgC